MMKVWLLILTLLLPMVEGGARTWTSVTGLKLEAQLLHFSLKGNTLSLRLESGEEHTMSLDKISDADLDYLKKMAEERVRRVEQIGEEAKKAGQVLSRSSGGVHDASYHIYYPKGYRGTERCPLLILFSPGGGGKQILTNFKKGADELKWILVGCDQLSNGMDEVKGRAIFGEMLPAIEKEVIHDQRALYMGGFSGGGMRAFGNSAQFNRPWRGIISCGGWLGGKENYGLKFGREMVVAMVNGEGDKSANSWVERDSVVLRKRGCRTRLFNFPGGHEVAPAEVLLQVMKWQNLQRR